MKKPKTKVKIYRDSKGRFVRVTKNGKRKKLYIKPDITERELIKFLIKTFMKSKRRKKKNTSIGDKTIGIKTIDPITSSVIQLMNMKTKNENEALQTIQNLKKEFLKLPLPAPQPPLAITDGSKERKHPRYSEEDIEDGIKMLEKAQQKKEQYKRKAIAEQKKVVDEKKKALEKDFQLQANKIKNKYTNMVIEGMYNEKALKDIASKNNMSMTGTKADLVRKLKKVGAFSHITQGSIDQVIEKKYPTYTDEIQSLENHFKESIDDLDAEEIDTSLITPVKLSRAESSNSSAAAASSSLSPQSGEGKNGDGQGLSTDQIEDMMKGYKGFLGCIPRDAIPSFYHKIKPHSRISWIMNTDGSKRSGQHWVACYLDCRKNGAYSIEYYDPLGKIDRPWVRGEFIQMIRPMLSMLNPLEYVSFKQNLIPDQSIKSSDCGYFAVKFLQDRYAGLTFKEATGFDKLGQKMIEKFKNKLGDHFPKLEFDSQTGEGILRDAYEWGKKKVKLGYQRLKNALQGEIRLHFGLPVRRLLEKYEYETITDLKVMREPINSFLNQALNWVTAGKFNENLKNLGYDKAMHLYLYIRLANGIIIRADKNHVIEMKIVSNWVHDGKNVEEMPVSTPNDVTLLDFLRKGIDKVGLERYFKYSSGSSNCQDWIKSNLSANGLWSNSIETFVMQDAKKIYENLRLLEQAAQRITDVAAKADVALHGEGKSKRKKSHN